MKFGICTEYEKAKLLKKLGYDYIELNLSSLASMNDTEFSACRDGLADAALPAETANVFFPGSIRLTGPEADDDVISAYTEHALSRAEELGIRIVVLGSSRSRNLPEGYDVEKGYRQFIHALQLCGDIAGRHGIQIAVEPLHFPESNLINRVSDGLRAAKDAAHPCVAALADLWHMYCEAEDFDVISGSAGQIVHIHIASPTRRYPRADDGTDYAKLRDALHACGYDARISIEAGTDDLESDAGRSLAFLKTLQ